LRKVGATRRAAAARRVAELLVLMSQLCYESDQDRDTLERSIEIASRDMQRCIRISSRRAESERAEQDAIMRATLESAIEGILLVDNHRKVDRGEQAVREMWRRGAVMESLDQRAVGRGGVKAREMADVVMSRIDGLYDTDATLRDELES